MQITTVVCDICQEPLGGNLPYSITHGDLKVVADLCERHAQQFDDLMKQVLAARGNVQPAVKSRKRKTTPMTMEEIEALKKEQQRG